MAEEMRNYKTDVMINPSNLEDEVLTQPSLYVIYMELFVDYSYKRDVVKSKLDYTEALIDQEIRKNPSKFGFDGKPTEGAIKNQIILDKRYQDVLKEFHTLSEKVNKYSGMRTAFEHRKKSLDNLVSLKIGGFYSDLKVTRKEKEINLKEKQIEQRKVLNKNPRLQKYKRP